MKDFWSLFSTTLSELDKERNWMFRLVMGWRRLRRRPWRRPRKLGLAWTRVVHPAPCEIWKVADLIFMIFENFYRHIIQTLFSFLYCGPWVMRRVGALVPTGYLFSFLYCRPWVLRRVGALVPTGYLVPFLYCGPWVLRRVGALVPIGYLVSFLYCGPWVLRWICALVLLDS